MINKIKKSISNLLSNQKFAYPEEGNPYHLKVEGIEEGFNMALKIVLEEINKIEKIYKDENILLVYHIGEVVKLLNKNFKKDYQAKLIKKFLIWFAKNVANKK